jgi:WD40 repeat protein
VWSIASALPVAKFQPHAGAKAALAWKPDNQLTVPAEGALETLAAKWTLERMLGSGDAKSPIADRVNALAFSPDGKSLAVGSGEPSRGGDITLWDASSGKLARALTDRHSDTVLSLEFSPDGKLIASGGADKQLRVSEVASGKQLKVFEGHTHHVMGVSWRADGRVIASSGADNATKVWDWLKGERRKNLDGWDKEVTSVRYLGATTRLVTTSGDKQVRLIGEDGSSPAALKGTTDFMQTSATTRNGQWIAAGGEDSIVRVWETKSATLVAEFARPDEAKK